MVRDVLPPFLHNSPRSLELVHYLTKAGIAILTLISTEVKSEADLLPPGAKPGTVPTDLEQATGLERLEILGKMQGIDIFDMRPLPSDRVGMFRHFDRIGKIDIARPDYP